MTVRSVARRLERLEERAEAWGLSEEARPPLRPEDLDGLSMDELYELIRQLLRAPCMPLSRRDKEEMRRLSRLSDEEVYRLYREKMGLPADAYLSGGAPGDPRKCAHHQQAGEQP